MPVNVNEMDTQVDFWGPPDPDVAPKPNSNRQAEQASLYVNAH